MFMWIVVYIGVVYIVIIKKLLGIIEIIVCGKSLGFGINVICVFKLKINVLK